MLRSVKCTKSAMFGMILASVATAGLGCGGTPTQQVTDGFEAGTGDTFGTLTDADAGSFEINMNEDGAVTGITIEGSNGESGGEVALPTADDPALAVTASDGSSISFTQDGESTAVVINDAELEQLIGESSLVLSLDGAEAGGLNDVLFGFLNTARTRNPAQDIPECEQLRDFVDNFCLLIGLLDASTLTQLIYDQLPGSVTDQLTIEQLETLIIKYMDVVEGFCTAWSEYRDTNDPCEQ